MNERLAVADDDLDKAASIANALERAEPLAALVLDVLSRQAEGRTLFVGEKYVAVRAEAHGVERAAAETPLGNLLAMLERGPESSAQWALCGALYVKGFAHSVRTHPTERKALVTRVAAHGDFLELGSPYRVLSALSRMLDAELAAEVHAAIGELVLSDDQGTPQAQARARNAGRIAVLGDARTAASHAALVAIESRARDAFSRALCALLLGRGPDKRESAVCTIHGHVGRFPGGPVSSLLRWLSGVALIASAVRLVLASFGVRREVEVELGDLGLRVRRRTHLLGRVVRTADEVHPLRVLRHARRATRYPGIHLVMGAFCFALGVVLGGVFSYDAMRLGDRSLAMIGVVLLLVGAGVDLLFEVLVPAGRGRVALELDLGRGNNRENRLRLAGVPMADADHFLQVLWRRVSQLEGISRAVD